MSDREGIGSIKKIFTVDLSFIYNLLHINLFLVEYGISESPFPYFLSLRIFSKILNSNIAAGNRNYYFLIFSRFLTLTTTWYYNVQLTKDLFTSCQLTIKGNILSLISNFHSILKCVCMFEFHSSLISSKLCQCARTVHNV